ncbi:phenolic glucoside malonyltransferase 2 [Oryza sativa Japonica Group]|uniref:Os02g0485800 protein n=2 Tax=Oryza sativa subsp. japonica TaxID=39947 RepID=Q6K6S9_ORYSJ|nr:phenolic glucoside malonyltransferase 2 [Oryza sativa Japonica Group]BAD21697.1 putative quercetin 3-O-glucoside-6''-O-malonyltransferase [Oryza sativa Japonica Group]BAD21967.1 putative quercetin 3-O-glucoside-6''-O-malonyltransferase [Oryza sativa Japonica Group]BAF08774.1 Os02g0485800 [Oryza sativa Japonica Group]|eukprot:NP_001046860.1 Os02g0485800 [Oryza sativa Japonica Group]
MAAPPHDHGGRLRVLRTEHVTPSSTGDDADALSERALPLKPVEPVERLFLYRLAPGAAVHGVLSHLADSLSRALRAFYPLAGRIRLAPGKTDRYELFYQPGDAVAFTVAEHDGAGVDELATDDPREVATIAPLVPALPRGGAVLAVQATVLLGLRPAAPRVLALGVTVHHAACDGASSTHFLHTWAASACAAAGNVPPEPPVMDHSFIVDRKDIHDLFAAPRAQKGFDSPDAMDRLVATYALSSAQLQSIKDAVAGEAARRGVVPPPRCTSIVATYGVMWLCHLRATHGHNNDGGHDDGGGRAYFLFVTDHRRRMEGRVPSRYFGNCVGPCYASMPRKAAATATVTDGVFTACSAVAAAIDEAVHGETGYWERYPERIVEARRDGAPFSVAGSPRFRVYDVDFGFGTPAKVEIASVAKTGAMSVAEGRGGSGGIEVGIALPPEHMGRFRTYLADVIAGVI